MNYVAYGPLILINNCAHCILMKKHHSVHLASVCTKGRKKVIFVNYLSSSSTGKAV